MSFRAPFRLATPHTPLDTLGTGAYDRALHTIARMAAPDSGGRQEVPLFRVVSINTARFVTARVVRVVEYPINHGGHMS